MGKKKLFLSCLLTVFISLPVFSNYADPLLVKRVQTDQPIISLTIDDGPHPHITPQILNVLKEENIKATFFLVASRVKQFPHLAQKILEEGHEIGNHSFNHRNFQLMSDDDLRLDIAKSQLIFKNIIGFFPRYFRPPYGRLKNGDVDLLKSFFKDVVYWSLDSRDWELPHNPTHVVDRVLSKVRPGHIILCHQRDMERVKTLRTIIKNMKGSGYAIVTVSDLLNFNTPQDRFALVQ